MGDGDATDWSHDRTYKHDGYPSNGLAIEMMYSTEDMVRKSGATNRQLGTWAGKGWLSSAAPGTGHAREWSERDLKIATLIVALMGAGFRLDKAAEITSTVINRDTAIPNVTVRLASGIWIIVRKDSLP